MSQLSNNEIAIIKGLFEKFGTAWGTSQKILSIVNNHRQKNNKDVINNGRIAEIKGGSVGSHISPASIQEVEKYIKDSDIP